MPTRDYVFRVHGDCVRAGYAYPLLAALKLNDPELSQDDRVFFGPLEGIKHIGRGYLTIREGTHWRARGPSELKDRFHRLCGRKLLIGDHVIRLGNLRLDAPRSATEVYAEFIAIKSMHFQKNDRHPTHREFLGWVTDKLRRKFKIKSGKVEVGRRRQLKIGEHPATTGYALGIYGVDADTGLEIQCAGLGGRRHMGGALFLPGMLPVWVRGEERRAFAINYIRPSNGRSPGSHEVYQSCELTQPSSGMHFVFRAAWFLRALRRNEYPNANRLAEFFGISTRHVYRFVKSIRDDLGAPIAYSDFDRGWELTDHNWKFVL